MRIHRLVLRDFRGVEHADVTFDATGVTVVQGPNEVGKSSLADAVDMLLEDLDSSGRARVKAAQPVGRDVGPSVEMEFESGPYRMIYTKQWVKGARTELRVTGPSAEQLTGREAHERVDAILTETLDVPLFQALRYQQGVPLGQADLGSSASLATALDVAATGGAPVTADDTGTLLDAIARERGEWSTAGGSPNKARTDLRAAAADARAQADEATARLAALEARVDHHRRLEREIAASAEAEPGMRDTVAALESARAALTAQEVAVRELDRTAQLAEGAAREAHAARAAREVLVAAVDSGEAALAELARQSEDADEALARATDARSRAAEALVRAGDVRAEADAALAIAVADAQHLREVLELEMFRERRDRAAAADAVIDEAAAFLESCALTDDLMQRIEDAAVEDAVSRGRLQAAGGRLVVRAESALPVETPDGSRALAPGEEIAVDLPPGAAVVVPGVVRVALAQGSGAEAAAESARRAADALAALLGEAGVPEQPVDAARALDRRRRDDEARMESARIARAEALRDLTADELADKITRATERVGAYTRRADATTPGPLTPEEAAAARTRAEGAQADALRAEDAVRLAHAAAERDVAALQGAQKERGGRALATAERLDHDRAALAEARALADDAVLTRRADEATAAAEGARARHAAEQALLAHADPESLDVRLENARDAVDRLVRERNDAALRAERLLGEISQQGDEGLADLAVRAGDAAADMEEDLARAERRADAAELLYDVMARHRDAARRAFVAPFRDEVERLARLVFGPGTGVEVDHATLQVVSRTRDGVTVPYEALSGGAREQLSVIGRLAAAILVAPAGDGDMGGAPVIIDDALGYSDSGRLEGIAAALSSAGRRCQVIVLTCVPERYAGIGSATTVPLGDLEP